jgi:ferredoxin
MPSVTNKFPDNSSGKFYVDNQCIDCDVCREMAPDHFTRNDEIGYSYVYNQPTTSEDIAKCHEAMKSCRVGAIGDDGNS